MQPNATKADCPSVFSFPQFSQFSSQFSSVSSRLSFPSVEGAVLICVAVLVVPEADARLTAPQPAIYRRRGGPPFVAWG